MILRVTFLTFDVSELIQLEHIIVLIDGKLLLEFCDS
jgi:hypothetical protein